MINNKIALVTGGGRGLGRDMALCIAKKGIDIVVTYNSNKNAAEEVVKEIETLGQKAIALQLDVANLSSFDGFILELQDSLKASFHAETIDFLINNGGFGINSPSFVETTEEQFDWGINISSYEETGKLGQLLSNFAKVPVTFNGVTKNILIWDCLK